MKMKQETKDKIKAKYLENNKKILDILGYEIWRDPLNYTVVKDKQNSYFSTLKNALVGIRDELIRNELSGSEHVKTAIDRIEKVDTDFIKALVECLAVSGRE